MYRLAYLFVFTVLLSLCYSFESSAAWPWGGRDNLVSINGVSYGPDDFRHWWENWRGDGSRFPDEPEQFIEWKLLVQEARSIELDGEPGYLSKIDTFYGARTRLRLKHDAIDSKVEISDKAITEHYLANYTPIFYISWLNFDTAEKAENAYNGIKNQEYTFDDLKKKGEAEGEVEGQPFYQEGKFRPGKFVNQPELRNVLDQLSVGQVSMPQSGGNSFFLVRLNEKSMPPENELETKRESILKRLRKEKARSLTDELLEDLWDKYEVQVDEELLAIVNKDPDKETLARPLVLTNRENMPLSKLVADVRRDTAMRGKKKVWTDEEKAKQAEGFMYGMIHDYLLTWEARDRRYEEKPPFKWVYEYYQEKRLIKELERRLIQPQVSVSDAEIRRYYEEHPDEFRPPEKISVIALQGEKEILNKVLREINQGLDFLQAGAKNNLKPIPMMNTPVSELGPGFKPAVMKLDIDEVSEVFEIHNVFYLAKLQKREKQELLPLAEFKDKISAKLQRKEFFRARQEYIEILLNQSDVEVNRRVWEKLKAEYTS
jgi:parvulin-like peptidyl-prolyl isomerase